MRGPNRFHGTFEQLDKIVALTLLPGVWELTAAGYWQFRCVNGAILNWWPTTKTFNFQGPAKEANAFRDAIICLLQHHCSRREADHDRRRRGLQGSR